MDKKTQKFSQTQESMNDDFAVIVSRNPLLEFEIESVEAGLNICQTVDKVLGINPARNNDNVIVDYNGERLTQSEWSEILPVKGDTIAIAVTPNGPALPIGWVIAISLAVSVVAGVIAYNLYKPDEPDANEDDRLAAITGMRNRKRPYEPFRAVLGKRRIAPDYYSEPYTYRKGDDEWFRALFCVGYGPLKIEDIKIGDTDFNNYEGTVEVLDYYEEKSYAGVRSLWPNDVVEDAPAITLKTGDVAIRDTAVAPDRVSLEFLLPRGLQRGEGWNNVAISHEYTTNETTPRNIKVAKIYKSGVDGGSFSNVYEKSSDFPLRPLVVVKMQDNTYRVCIDYKRDGVEVHNSTKGLGIYNPRNVLRRSWGVPPAAIIKEENGYVHIDADILNGEPRGILQYTGPRVEADYGDYSNPDNYSFVQDGTWSSTSNIAAAFYVAKSTRQRRFDLEYRPVGVYTNDTLETRTVKSYPSETPDDASIIDEVVWTKFRTIRYLSNSDFENLIGHSKPPLRYTNSSGTLVTVNNFRPVIIAVELKATDQLSGTLDNLNVLATSVVPIDWNYDWRSTINLGTAALKPTENPAEVYRLLLQGPITDFPRANSQVDLDGLAEWRDYCNAAPSSGNYPAPQWKVSYESIQQSTIQELLNKVAFTGRAEFSHNNGRYGVVVRDRRVTPVQVVSNKNSWNFQASRVFPEVDDGIKFKFDNENEEYQQDEDYFQYPGITNPKGKYKGLTIQGVPNYNMAYRIARYSYYEELLQREIYKVTMDVEGLILKRGSLVIMQNDIIDVGLGAGRVKSINANIIAVDETLDMEVGTSYGFVFRLSDGTIEDVVLGQYLGGGEVDLAFDLSDRLLVNDFMTYGQPGVEKNLAQVVSIDYSDNLEVTVTLVNYDEKLYDIDEASVGDPDYEPIPEFQTNLNARIEFVPPNPPSLEVLDSEAGIDIAKQQLYLSIEYTPQLNNRADSFDFQYRDTLSESSSEIIVIDEVNQTVLTEDEINGGDDRLDILVPALDDDSFWTHVGNIPSQTNQFVFQGVERGVGYRFRARSRGITGLFSSFSNQVNVIVPFSLPPDSVDVDSVSFEHKTSGTFISWNPITDPDFKSYEIRTGTDLEDDSQVVDNVVDSRVNIGYLTFSSNPTYYIYAKTVYNEYSEIPASVLVTPPVFSPIDVADLDVTLNNVDNITIDWELPVEVNYPILGVRLYQDRPDDVEGFFVVNSLIVGESYTVVNQPVGTSAFRVEVVYAGNNYSAITEKSGYVKSYIPPVVTGFTQYSNNQGTFLNWDNIVEALPDFELEDFQYYEVRSNNSPGDAAGIVTTTQTSEFNAGFIPASGAGSIDYFVFAKSLQGKYSDVSSSSVTRPAFPEVVNLQVTYEGYDIIASWDLPDNSNTYPVRSVEVRVNRPSDLDGYDNSQIVSNGLNDAYTIKGNESHRGNNIVYVVVRYAAGNVSTVVSAPITIPQYAPPQVQMNTQIDRASGTIIRWQPVETTPDFNVGDLSYYEVREFIDGSEEVVTTTSGTTFNIGYVDGNDLPVYRVYARSVQGFYSPLSQFIPDAPFVQTVQNLIAVPINNTVVIDWEEPASTIYPVESYLLETKLPGRDTFERVGKFSSTYTTLTEREQGNYTFRVATIDLGGNQSEFVQVVVRVFEPTDFVLFYEKDVDLRDGQTIGGAIATNDGEVAGYFPLRYNLEYFINSTAVSINNTSILLTDEGSKSLTKRIQEAADASGTTFELVTTQEKITNVGEWIPQYTLPSDGSVGYPISPSDTDCAYQQSFDIYEGSDEVGLPNIAGTTIAFIPRITNLSPEGSNVTYLGFIETSTDGVNWSTPIQGIQTFIEDPFRYFRITIVFNTNGDTSGLPYIRMDGINIAIDVKQITDQGTNDIVGASDPNFPTEISFKRGKDVDGNDADLFLDIQAVTASVSNDDLAEKITIKTEFEYPVNAGDPNSPIVRDKFKAYAQNVDTGAFVPVRISWIARGIANQN